MKIDNNFLEQTQKTESKGTFAATSAGKEKNIKRVEEDEIQKSFSVANGSYEKPSAVKESEQAFIEEDFGAMDATQRKNQMAVLSNTTSPEEYRKMQEDGYHPEDADSRTIVTVTDKIKMQLAKGGADISIMGDELTKEQLEAIGGSMAGAVQLSAVIQEAEQLQPMTESDMKYLLTNELEPTIDNLYKAQHSGSTAVSTAGVDIAPMQQQVEQVIAASGRDVNEESLTDSKWMLENGISLTSDNLNYLEQLKQLKLPLEEDALVQFVSEAVLDGKNPQNAPLMDGYSNEDIARDAATVIQEVTDEDLAYLVAKGDKITIENLEEAVNLREAGKTDSKAVKQVQDATQGAQALSLITARRQLEETRLMMTEEANLSLIKKGIHIDTAELGNLVEELKSVEQDFYQDLLADGNTEVSKEQVNNYTNTLVTVDELKNVPAYVLGIKEVGEDTLAVLHENGKIMQDTFEKANESYEALMTAPRSDLGDRISKAFQNVPDILADLGMEPSASNQRAVRILAYNQLEITQESVLQMKAADEQVQRTFSNLTPGVVRSMIQEGTNPLEMNLTELNQHAQQLKEQNGTDQEKFSEFLWKLEQNHAISREERTSYIGIYRLMNQVEKNDGAAIGAIVAQGGELSMKNLLTAVRSGRKTIDYSVDDEFGGVDAVSTDNASISDQIMTAFQTDCMSDVMETLTPTVMKSMVENGNWENATPEQLKEMVEQLQSQPEISEQEAQANQEYAKEQLRQFQAAASAEKSIYEILDSNGISNTVNNILAVNGLVHQRNKVFQNLFSSIENFSGEDVDFAAIENEILQRFSNALEAPEEMAKAQENLADTAENVMKTMLPDADDVSAVDVKAMQMVHKQLSIASAWAKEDTYTIPVMVGNEATNVTLKLVQGKDKKSCLDVLFETANLGKVSASFHMGTDRTSGFVVSDAKETLEKIKQNPAFENMNLATAHVENLDLAETYTKLLTMRTEENTNFNGEVRQKEEIGQSVEEKQQDQADRPGNKELYQFAKAFLEAVKEIG